VHHRALAEFQTLPYLVTSGTEDRRLRLTASRMCISPNPWGASTQASSRKYVSERNPFGARLTQYVLCFEHFLFKYAFNSRSQWPRGLRRGSAAARLLGLRLPIPPEAWESVSCECCVLSGIGLCVGLITRPEKSYRVRCV
jgi:hypothetical protein